VKAVQKRSSVLVPALREAEVRPECHMLHFAEASWPIYRRVLSEDVLERRERETVLIR